MNRPNRSVRAPIVLAAAAIALLVVAGSASGRLDRIAHPASLDVSKTATTTWERVNTWSVEKSVDPASLSLAAGGSGNVTWSVVVTKTGSFARNARVSGTITVGNPNPGRVTDVSVSDSLPGAVVDCGGGASSGFTIQAGNSLTCTYTAAVDSTAGGTNVASATGIVLRDRTIDGSGSAAYSFGEPASDVNASVTAVDDGHTWSGITGSTSFDYGETFRCPSQGRTNVVRLLGDNPDTQGVETDYELGTDSASVTVRCGSTPPPSSPPPGGNESMDVQIVKTATPQAQLANGQADIAYTLVATNNGPNQAHNVVVSDAAPSGVTFVSVTAQPDGGSCTVTPSLLDCSLGTLGPGVSRTIGVAARVTQTGTYENCATVAGEGGDTNSMNNTDCAETLVTAPLTPPVTPPVTPPATPKPKPKPHPKPVPNLCRVLTINTKMVKANGQRHAIVAKVTRSRNPVKGVKVRFTGAGISMAAVTNRDGVARVGMKTTRAGIVRVNITNAKACNTARIGVVGVFQPPVTG